MPGSKSLGSPLSSLMVQVKPLLKKFTSGLYELYRNRPRLKRPAWLCLDIQLRPIHGYHFQATPQRDSCELFSEEQLVGGQLVQYANDWLVALMEEGQCFHQELTLGLSDSNAIEQILPFQLEHILPFPSQEAVWAFAVHSLPQGSSRVFVSCTRRHLISQCQQQIQSLGLELDLLVSPAFAMQMAHQLGPCPKASCLYAWLRASTLTFFLIDATGIRGVRDLLLPPGTLTAETLQQEMRKTALYLQATPGYERCLMGQLEGCSELIDSFDTPLFISMSLQERAFLMLKAAAQLVNDPHSRSMLFIPPHSSRRLKAWSKCARALSSFQKALAALTASALLLSYASHAHSDRRLETSAQALIQQAQKFDIELPSLNSDTPLQEWLDNCTRQLDQRLSLYPLAPNLPGIRDGLTWISQLIGATESAKLISFDYTSETYPDPKHPSGRYRVKVELELEIADLSVAEQIQQQLLKAYSWIDRPQSLSWKAQKDRYKVSFYLKDRTHYAS